MSMNLAVWKEFWALRNTVQKAMNEKIECDEKIVSAWKNMRNRILEEFYPIVHKVATAMHKKIAEVSEDEMASFGVDGLYDAIDGYSGYDPRTKRPVKFETYATYRIRGSILDGIRRDDWVPRLVRSNAKLLRNKKEDLSASLGREPTHEELAKAMNLSMEEYEEMLDASNIKSIQSLNAMVRSNGGGRRDEEVQMVDCLPDRDQPEPLAKLMEHELLSKLFGKGFTPAERKIIAGYYFENRPMKEIGKSVDLSESRVSQKNTEIIERVKENILRNPEFFGKKVLELLKG